MSEDTIVVEEETLSTINRTNNLSKSFLCGVVEGFYGRPWTSEQRKDLFSKLKRFGMNVYMYAPKDDLKHRNLWRESYTVEESEQLSVLINNSKSHNILFIYAISPGLDIGYSNPRDLNALKRKLDQVKRLGCEAFALLFDDIEPELNENDREAFKSFADAQVSVTNDVFQHLDQPVFLFCPTEYCSSRAIPSVQHSDYLATIGSKLNSNIEIMWTGQRVISQSISLPQIQELTDVLNRKPIIWDNLHANDYDQKRIFLGPYSDRSTKLISHLKGVLTNPNCEYEANFIPIHTLAQWSKCTQDANETMNSDIKLESELENGSIENVPTELDPKTYHPKHALKVAINEWIPEFYKVKNPQIKPNIALETSNSMPPNQTIQDVYNPLLNNGINKKNHLSDKENNETFNINNDNDESIGNGINGNDFETNNTKETLNDLNENKENASLEPMDCNPSPDLSLKINSLLDVPMIENSMKDDANSAKVSMNSVDSDDMQTEPVMFESDEESNMLKYDDISLLVDLFYLPFEHGPQGIQFLHEFHWLKTNGYIVSEYRRKRNNEQQTTSSEINEWYEKAAKFNDMTMMIGRLLTRLTFCKNRSLLYELYPYVWDIKGVISLLNSYVKWIALARVPVTDFLQPLGFIPATFTWFSKGYKEAFQSGEQEPWLFRGGLTGELQRMLPVESIGDLLLYKAPDSPTSRIYTIRPYLLNDQPAVYEVCFKNYERHIYLDGLENLVGDRLIGGFLNLSPEYCFVVEDEMKLCGYALAVLDAKKFFAQLKVSWIPEILKKYPLCTKENDENATDTGNCLEEKSLKDKYKSQFIKEMHKDFDECFFDPEIIFKTYPSLLNFSVMSNIMDFSVPKRMLTCLIAALKANGSQGIYSKILNNDKKSLDFYFKLGFQIIKIPNAMETDDFYVGRII